jgi:hypothetical protein
MKMKNVEICTMRTKENMFLLGEIDVLLMKSKIIRIRNMILNNTWQDLQRSFQVFLRNEED